MLTHATLGQIGEAMGRDKSTISRRAEKEAWDYEERPEQGGMTRYYVLAQLPTKVAQAVNTHFTLKELQESGLPPSDSTGGADAAASLFSGDLESLKTWAQGRAIRLTPKELADPKIAKKLHCARAMEECPAYMGRVAVADSLAAHYGVKRNCIYQWWDDVKAWRVKAKTPLIQVEGVQIELPKSNAFDEDALAWGVGCYAANLKHGQKWAYGKLQAEAEKRGWKIGDYTSFNRLVGRVPDKVWEYIRKGPTGFELSTAPKITRAWLETPAYDVLCGDQNILDYLVVDEITGEILVMNLYLWMDCTSRAWTGIWPEFGPYRAYTVGYSLRESCRLAMPGEIFTDWGKCELSRYIAGVLAGLSPYCRTGDFEDMGSRYGGMPADDEEGIGHRKTAGVRQPWKKPIENQMNILKRLLLDMNLPGFRQKMDEPWANSVRQMDLKIAMKRGHLMTLEQMLSALLSAMERHNRG